MPGRRGPELRCRNQTTSRSSQTRQDHMACSSVLQWLAFSAGSKDTNRSGLCRTCPAHSPQPNLQNTGLFIKSPPRRGEGPCRASPFSVRTPARADCPLPVHLCGDRESVQFTCLRCRKWISSGGLWERPGGARCLPYLDVDFSPSMAFSEFH